MSSCERWEREHTVSCAYSRMQRQVGVVTPFLSPPPLTVSTARQVLSGPAKMIAPLVMRTTGDARVQCRLHHAKGCNRGGDADGQGK